MHSFRTPRMARFLLAGLCAVTGISLKAQSAAVDPGVRAGSPAAGGPLQSLTSGQSTLFAFVAARFSRLHSVSGLVPGEDAAGLGPGYNANGCAACHTFPSPGGSSPAVNPQIAMATLHGAQNSVPSFLSANGPIRVARFVQNADGSPDGGVHNLFTIQGREDAPGCQLAQPDFATALAQNNVVFRIPTPVFGAGLIENISDQTILINKYSYVQAKGFLGIDGHENRNPNDGTITKFGWKAQNKSLLMFSGEAYNVEIGVTNELFPNERNMVPGCDFNPQPEDRLNFDVNSSDGGVTSDFQNFTTFMRFLAPPTPAPDTPSIANGRSLFTAAGCILCHSQSLETSGSVIAGLSLQVANLYSDLLVHHMGAGLADGIQQGSAGPDEFRTAPLWGLGQRIFFLHDGRTTDLMQAIQAHQSAGSEANATIANFSALTPQQQQDLLNFLRSL